MNNPHIEEAPFEEMYEIERYGTYYSEKKFWTKISRIAARVGRSVLCPVFQLYYLLQDQAVSIKHKAYIVGALGYFILPIDLIPESIFPLIGFTDDIAVIGIVLKLVQVNLTPEIIEKANAKVMELLKTGG